jgi:hypothetical protein
MTRRKPSVTEAGESQRRPPTLPATHRALRGPRVLDPFACETLTYPRLSPLEVACEPLDEPTLVRPGIAPALADGSPGEPLDEPTVVYRPWTRELALELSARAADRSLANTLARPVLSPTAVTVRAPTPAAPAPKPRRGPERPTTAAPLLHKCIAGLILAALLLVGLRVLTRRAWMPSVKTGAAISAPDRATAATSDSPHSRSEVGRVTKPSSSDGGSLPLVNGKTPERQAVDLVARGAYTEAAALYEQLIRQNDFPALREAARIARRKARLSK